MSKKEKQVEEKGIINKFFNWKFNKAISKISNLMLVAIFVVFAIIIIVIAGIEKKKEISNIFVPNYEHVFYNDQINSHFAIIAQRTYDSENNETLSYRVIFYNQGRYINSTEPGYPISSFVARAGLVDSLNSNEIEEMYYFTEQQGSTSTSHNYTVNKTDADGNKLTPKYLYSRIQYRVGSEEKIATFKEEVMLVPTAEDIDRFDKVYTETIAPAVESYKALDASTDEAKTILSTFKNLNLKNVNGETIGTAQITASRDDDTSRYSTTVRCSMTDRSTPYHIDLQSWIINEKGNYLPFIGAYNFSSDHDYYNSGSYSIYDQVKCKYLCIKVVCYDNQGNSTTSYYKQAIDMMASAFVQGNDGVSCTYNN